MTTIPSSHILDIPFRRSVTLSLSSAIKQYISAKYDQHPDMFTSDLATIDKLRTDAINVQEPHISGTSKLARYAAHLQWISGKFPIDIGADFSWFPALGYGTDRAVTQNNLQFERANVLYNMSALYSKLATQSPRNDAVGLKNACNWYCAAAGVLKYLKDEVVPQMRSSPPEDMDEATLGCLEELMLAQAQECFWLRAVVDGNRDSIVAKLAASVADHFDRAAEAGAKSGSVRSEWVHHMTAKHCHFSAASQYRQSLDCLERSKYGEEVSRLKDGLDRVNEAIKAEGRYLNKIVLGDLIALKEKVTETLKGAEKDNDLIYLSTVPPVSALQKIKRADMVSSRVPKEITDANTMLTDTGPFGAPLFAKLVPFAVHLAASIYVERRDRLVNGTIIDELEILTAKLHDLLQSLNLPGSLQALEKPLGLPPAIVAHAEEVRQQGGVDKLLASIADIDKLKFNDRAMYTEAADLLRTEAAEDDKLRQRHGTARWQRDPSAQASGKLQEQVGEYNSILDSADKSDALVRNKLRECEPVLRLLGGRLDALHEFVPNSSRASLTPKLDREAGKLRQRLNEVSRLESRRKRKIEALVQKAKADDINTQILSEAARLERENSVSKIEPADFVALFNARLEAHYAPEQAMLTEETEEQEELITHLKEANAGFLACRRVDHTLKEREDALQKLDAAHNRYAELMSNLNVGRKFYNDLAKLLTRFRDEAKHFVAQRREEAVRVESELTSNSMRLSQGGTGLPLQFGVIPPHQQAALEQQRIQQQQQQQQEQRQAALEQQRQQQAQAALDQQRLQQQQQAAIKQQLKAQQQAAEQIQRQQQQHLQLDQQESRSPPPPPPPPPQTRPTRQPGLWSGDATTAIRFAPPAPPGKR